MDHATSRQHRRRTCSCWRLPALELARHEAAHGPKPPPVPPAQALGGLRNLLTLAEQRSRGPYG